VRAARQVQPLHLDLRVGTGLARSLQYLASVPSAVKGKGTSISSTEGPLHCTPTMLQGCPLPPTRAPPTPTPPHLEAMSCQKGPKRRHPINIELCRGVVGVERYCIQSSFAASPQKPATAQVGSAQINAACFTTHAHPSPIFGPPQASNMGPCLAMSWSSTSQQHDSLSCNTLHVLQSLMRPERLARARRQLANCEVRLPSPVEPAKGDHAEAHGRAQQQGCWIMLPQYRYRGLGQPHQVLRAA
jgi:hypothetical protein